LLRAAALEAGILAENIPSHNPSKTVFRCLRGRMPGLASFALEFFHPLIYEDDLVRMRHLAEVDTIRLTKALKNWFEAVGKD
jgi:hypothetical protein